MILVGALAIKALQGYSSTVILFKHGLNSDGLSHTRILMENCMKLCAIINDDDYFNYYIFSEEYERYMSIKALQESDDILNEYELLQVKNILLEKPIKKFSKRKYGIRKIARLANMEKFYL